MTGRRRENTPKITEEIMIERDRFFDPMNSPRYANITLVDPEMLTTLMNIVARNLSE